MGKKTIIAIDGNSLINRAFYALPPMSNKEGTHTNAVFGFIRMLNVLIGSYQPEYLCVAFDMKAPTFRHLEYSEYKAGRKKMPFELAEQFPLIKKILRAMDIRIIELEGFEADDIIGTVARRGEEAGLQPYIITGDKDALQLATDVTSVIITKKGVSEFDTYDAEAMQERYHMTPAQFIDLKGLMGDSSDNIPGIPGVGEKTGIKLIEEFGSVANLVEHADEITKPALKAKVKEYGMQAMMSRRLAEINTNVPIETDFEAFRFDGADKGEVVRIYRELELFSLISGMDKTWLAEYELVENNGNDAGLASEKSSASTVDYETEAASADSGENSKSGDVSPVPARTSDIAYPDFDSLECRTGNFSPEELYKDISDWPYVYIKIFGDNNHVGRPAISGGFFAGSSGFYYLTDDKLILKAAEAVSDSSIPVRGHLLKDDYFMLMCLGKYLQAEENTAKAYDNLRFKTEFDTGIAEYILSPSRNDFGYRNMAIRYGCADIADEKDFVKENAQIDIFSGSDDKYRAYAVSIAKQTVQIEKAQRDSLLAMELEKLYYDIELPLIEVFADMEFRGFRTDRSVLTEIGSVISERIEELQETVYRLAGESFNINSPKQLGVILFEKLGLPAGKKTKTGYSTSVDVLEKLRDDYEIVGSILEFRTLSKLRSTYIEGLTPLIGADGKIRAHFQQTGTATGRISCTEPNLQNIPVRQEPGRQLRRAFIPDEGCILVDADYSQIELRVLAHLSEDEGMIEAFKSGADIHRATAARVFEVDESEVTPLQRSGAKAVNFGVIYGMSGFGLSENLNITRKEAESYISDYFRKYTGVKAFMEGVVEGCRDRGYVTTIFGRRRDIPDIKASNFIKRQLGERLAMNSPVQGSAADIIKIAMVKVFNELRDGGFRSKLILQVHDELIINTYPDEAEAVRALLKRCMMEAAELLVPLEVGMESGASWYDIH